MGFFSGLTANGILGTVARGVRDGSFLPPFAGPGAAPAAGIPARGAGLLDQLGGALDPQRLTMIQATLAGDYDAVARMTEPLRRQRMARRTAMGSGVTAGQVQDIVGTDPAGYESHAGDATGHDLPPSVAAEGRKSLSKVSLAAAGQDDVMTRQMATAPEPAEDQTFIEAIAENARRAVEAEQIRRAPGPERADGRTIWPGASGRARAGAGVPAPDPVGGKPDTEAGWRAYIEKLRRDGGLNGYGYIPTEEEVNLLTRAAYSEFSRESNWPDLHAGVWAILNRIRPNGGYGRHRNELGLTLEEVLTRQAPNGVQQYPFMPRGGVDAPGGSAAWQRSARPDLMIPAERKAWELSLQAVKDVLRGAYPDPTAGASYYRNRRALENA